MLHDLFYPFLLKATGNERGLRLLDIGPHEGDLTKRLPADGFDVRACDKFPEVFKPEDIPCDPVDVEDGLPYDDASFDVVLAVEIVEHVLNPGRFFGECARVLRPGGRLVMTVPNIVSLRSRIRFLFTGFPHTFFPIDSLPEDGMAHLAALSSDQIRHIARRNGLTLDLSSVDRRQGRSRIWLWLYPLIRLQCRRAGHDPRIHNSMDLLLGRKLFLSFIKTAQEGA